MRAALGRLRSGGGERRLQPMLKRAAGAPTSPKTFGTPSHPANTPPTASTINGTVMEQGDSWM